MLVAFFVITFDSTALWQLSSYEVKPQKQVLYLNAKQFGE